MRLCALLLAGWIAAGIGEAQTSFPCEASPEVRRALDALPDPLDTDFRIPFDERLRPIRELAQRYPRDLFVLQRYQDSFWRNAAQYQEFDRAFALYRTRPQDPVYRYLAARLTGRSRPVTAAAQLEQLSAEEPGFPQPHLALVELTDRPSGRDAAAAERHLRAYLAACPDNLEGYAQLRLISDPAMLRSGAVKFRALLQGRQTSATLRLWRTLWDLEFRAAPPDQQEAARQRVLEDVEALRKRPPVATASWHSLFRRAAELTHDDSIRDWADQAIQKLFPQSSLALNLEEERWKREHPVAGRTMSYEQMDAYQALESAHVQEMYRKWPGQPTVIWRAWQYANIDDKMPLERRLAITDDLLALRRRSPDAGLSVPPVETQMAELYVRWRVRLDQVPGLLAAGMRQVALQQKYQLDLNEMPEEFRRMPQRVDWEELTRRRSQVILADFYLQQKNLERAHTAVAVGLAELEPGKEGDHWHHEWLVRRARLAELEGHPQDALALYREHMAHFPTPVLEGRQGMQEVREEVARARQLYLTTGGTANKWLEWVTSGRPQPSAAAPPALVYEAALPDFEAGDNSGKVWRLANLKGKATFIDVWATWCTPCRAQHAELQKLYEQLRSRPNLQVLTFSIDDNSYLVESYLKEQRYTFPVVVSPDLADRLFSVIGVPQGWIIDARGRRSSPAHLIRADDMITELEKAAAK